MLPETSIKISNMSTHMSKDHWHCSINTLCENLKTVHVKLPVLCLSINSAESWSAVN